MNVLVVGGAGYVGSIVRPALEAEHDCRYLDLVPVPGSEQRTTVASVHDVEAADRALRGMDAVVYLAMGGTPRPAPGEISINDIEVAFSVNCAGTYRFLDMALAAGIRRFVYTSSLSVYHHAKPRRDAAEDAPADSWYPYGLTKRVAEFICQAAAQHCPEATVLALRLFHPRNETDYAAICDTHRADPDHPVVALGPNDTRRLYLAALACDSPGAHILHAAGDVEETIYCHDRVRALLGWQPSGE